MKQKSLAFFFLVLLSTAWAHSAESPCAPSLGEVGNDLPLRLPFRAGEQYKVTQGYCSPGGDHHGYEVDFALPAGTPVIAAAAGTVEETGDFSGNCPSGCGNVTENAGVYVKIRHQGKATVWYSSYLHLTNTIVNIGDPVTSGQQIGTSGNTGWSTGPHLHFHIRNGPTAADTGFGPIPIQGIETTTRVSPITNFHEGYMYRALDHSTMSGTVVSWGQQIIPYVEPESRFTQIATGGGHNLGLKSDGTVVAWGSNGAGESQVPHDLGKVVAVAAADSHTLALRTDGTVVAWGQVWNGLIWVPATVASNLGNIIAIATGVGHSLALKSDGTVVAWGWNEFGQTTVPENLSGVIAIAAGHAHSLALKSDGTVVAWGLKEHGQSTVPTNLRGVIAISAGNSHNLALKSDGTVVAWGGGNFDGEITVPANLTGIVAIAAGGAHSLALKSDGTTVAWGSNNFGQITIPDDLSGVIAITARGHNSLALKFDGTIVAWGNNYSGQNEGPHSFGPVVAIAAAYNHSLALKSNGTVLHWGEDYFGAQSTLPESLSGVISIAAGYYHSLALKSDGTLVAWGAGGPGQSNSIDHGQSIVPSNLIGAIGIAAGGYHSLALESNGIVVTWGAGRLGQSGDPHYGQGIVPSNLNSVIAVAAGYYHSLALKSDGTVVAWGAGRPGQSGGPHHGQSIVPSNLNSVIAVAAGYYHSLALKSDGTVVAWGAGRLGQSPNYGQSEVPGNLTKVVAIAAGGYHSLALKSGGTVVTWGAGKPGQSGDAHYGQSILPPDLIGVSAIAAGGSYSLALVRDMAITTIDFETMTGTSSFLPGFKIPEPSKLRTQYSSKGVVFSSIAGYAVVVALGDGHATSGINGIGSATLSGELTYSRDSPIKVTFVSPPDANLPAVTSYASIRIDNAHSSPELSVLMEAYGLAGDLIGSAAVADNSNAVLVIKTPGIHTLLLYGNGTTAFDDLTFEPVRDSPAGPNLASISTLEIVGPTEATEGQQINFRAEGTDASGRKVDFTTRANWRVPLGNEKNFTLNSGQFQWNSQLDAPITVNIEASVTEGNRTLRALTPLIVHPKNRFRVKINEPELIYFDGGVIRKGWKLSATSAGPNGIATDYEWKLKQDTIEGRDKFVDSIEASPTIPLLPPGTYLFELTAYDSSNAAAADFRYFTVNHPFLTEGATAIKVRDIVSGKLLDKLGNPLTSYDNDWIARKKNGLIIIAHGISDTGQSFTNMAQQIAIRLAHQEGKPVPNICIYDWREMAEVRFDLSHIVEDMSQIRTFAVAEGILLAQKLEKETDLADKSAPVHLIGHSAGGFVLAQCALLERNWITQVTCLDTPFPIRSHFTKGKYRNPGRIERYISSCLGGAFPWADSLQCAPELEQTRYTATPVLGNPQYLPGYAPDDFYFRGFLKQESGTDAVQLLPSRRPLSPVDPLGSLVERTSQDLTAAYEASKVYHQLSTAAYTDSISKAIKTGFYYSPFMGNGFPAPPGGLQRQGVLPEPAWVSLTNPELVGNIVSVEGGWVLPDGTDDSAIGFKLALAPGVHHLRFEYSFTKHGDGDFLSLNWGTNQPIFLGPDAASGSDFLEIEMPFTVTGAEKNVLRFTLVGRAEINAAVTVKNISIEYPLDSDGDDLPDATEAQLGTNPLSRDTDGDGLVDGEEVLFYHTNPLLADSDGDGISDFQEILDGTDPLDRNSAFKFTSVSLDASRNVQLEYLVPFGRKFSLMRSPLLDLLDQYTLTNAVASAVTNNYIDRPTTNQTQFYWLKPE
jgi:alpha-tubulin suppressor-like RCC1 family protein